MHLKHTPIYHSSIFGKQNPKVIKLIKLAIISKICEYIYDINIVMTTISSNANIFVSKPSIAVRDIAEFGGKVTFPDWREASTSVPFVKIQMSQFSMH